MNAILMGYPLHGPPSPPRWPQEVRLGTFGEREAREVHAMFERAYAGGGGSVGDFEAWWANVVRDEAYDPELCFALYGHDGRILAAAQCWDSGFIKDLAVDPDAQRRGLGRQLLHHCLHAFWKRQASMVMLKVLDGNERARRLYQSAGMIDVPV